MNKFVAKKGIKLRIMKDVDAQVKLACKEFIKWLRNNYEFPIPVNIYIKSSSFILSRSKEHVSATFFGPFDKLYEPCIKISTGDYKKLKSKNGMYNAIMAILCSLAHEIIHYFEWCEDKSFKEREVMRKAKKTVETFSEYKEGLITCNNNSFKLIKVADRLLNSGKYQDAIKLYDKVIAANPEICSLYISKGAAYDATNEFEEAVKSYDKAIEIEPFNEELYISKGYSLDCLNKYNEALLCYEKAIKLNPNLSIAYNNMGYALLCLEKYKEAIDLFNKAINLDAEDEGIYIYKAKALMLLSKYEDSLSCLDMALQLNTESSIAYAARGNVLFKQGKFQEAIKNYDKSLIIDPEYAEAYYYKAASSAMLNNEIDSIENLKKAINLDCEYKKYAIEEKYFDNLKILRDI